MCRPGYHHNGFVATHVLGHMMYHLNNIKNVKNNLGGVLLSVAYNFTKSNTPPWVLSTFFKLQK